MNTGGRKRKNLYFELQEKEVHVRKHEKPNYNKQYLLIKKLFTRN